MQIPGMILLVVVLAFGFTERELNRISAFDLHALVMVLGGSVAAIMISSTARAALGTLLCFRELIPFAGTLQRGSRLLESERSRFVDLWREGRRAQAVELAERSTLEPIKQMLSLTLARASEKTIDSVFMDMRHRMLERWQPSTTNWELLARLGPSFGLVGTVTGMVQLFRNMANDDLNIGAAMSMALVSTLYGIAFGAGMAGPVGHYLRGLLDERLGALARCRQSAVELADRGAGEIRLDRGV